MKTQNSLYLLPLAKVVLIVQLSVIYMSCGEAASVPKESPEQIAFNKNGSKRSNINLSILMDLSDRISPTKHPNSTMDYYKRDLGYIKSISEAFINHLSGKKIISIDDRIQTFFDPPPGNQSINNLSDQLKFYVNKSNVSKSLISEISTKYTSIADSIYQLSIRDNHYIGSNTWGFFRDNISDYCLRDGYNNILVILTDGYMYHKDMIRREVNKTSYLRPEDIRRFRLTTADWHDIYSSKGYGFLPANINLSKLNVLVLGLNPQPGNSYEKDVLVQYWKDWLLQMGIEAENISIKASELPSNLDLTIKDFIAKRSQLN